MAQTRITLRALLDAKKPIWVRNSSQKIAKRLNVKRMAKAADTRIDHKIASVLPPGKTLKRHKAKFRAGIVVFKVGEGENAHREAIPPGRDPVCLSDRIDWDSLKKCTPLFQLINDGALELLDPDDAEKYYQENEGRREIMERKVNDMQNDVRLDEAVVGEVTSSVVEVDPSVTDLCLKIKTGVYNELDAVEVLEERRGSYEADELAYIANNGKFQAVKDWAQREMNDLEPDTESK